MNWLKRVFGTKTERPGRITRKVALDTLEKTGYILKKRCSYLSPRARICCAVGLAALYVLGDAAAPRVLYGDEVFSLDLVAKKTGYPLSYLEGLEDGFEGWSMARVRDTDFVEGYTDGLKLMELAVGGDDD